MASDISFLSLVISQNMGSAAGRERGWIARCPLRVTSGRWPGVSPGFGQGIWRAP